MVWPPPDGTPGPVRGARSIGRRDQSPRSLHCDGVAPVPQLVSVAVRAGGDARVPGGSRRGGAPAAVVAPRVLPGPLPDLRGASQQERAVHAAAAPPCRRADRAGLARPPPTRAGGCRV